LETRQILRANIGQAVLPIKHIGKGNFLTPQNSLHANAIILHQDIDLLSKIGRKHGRAGHADRVIASPVQPTKGAEGRAFSLSAIMAQPDFGISETAIATHRRVWHNTVLRETANRLPQTGNGLIIQGF
jgi:hypothetical protein